ncbi:MAG: PorP/SprF family type IX secretion system membrane protein [Saprospiraceae bacterium]|nr:PorP/SprF family type IX secretion system membrane protein [Saprospiraceae bacterium]
MKLHAWITLTIWMCSSTTLSAQQLASWSQFRTFHYAYNPAAIEVFELDVDGNPLDVDLAYRTQWTGFPGAPRTAVAGIQYTNIYQHMSMGGTLVNDAFGPTEYTRLQLQYAYQLNFARREEHFLSLGISGSAAQFRIRTSELSIEQPSDPLIGNDDQSTLGANLGLGVYYLRKLPVFSNATYLFAGVSVDQLLPSSVRFADGSNLPHEQHWYTFAGVRYYYDGYDQDYLEPVARVRYAVHSPLHFAAGVKMTFLEQRFWAGVSLGSSFQYELQLGTRIAEQWMVSYGAGSFLSARLGQPAGLSHELTLSFRGLL